MTDIEKNRHNWNGPPIVYGPSTSRNNDLTVVDLFCGPGGISEGFSSQGFDSIIGADIHEHSVETYRDNHPESYAILGDVRKITGEDEKKDIVETIRAEDYGEDSRLAKIFERTEEDNPTVLCAGIPCQGFSIANKKRSDEDDRNYLFEEFVKATKILNPEFVLVENVSTMKSAKDGEFVDAIHYCLNELGFEVENKTLDAEKFGVPQKRKRLFFLGSRVSDDILWPSEKYSEDSLVTVEQAISDLAKLEVGESGTSYVSKPNNEYQKMMRQDNTSYENHQAPNHRERTVQRIKDTEPGEPMYENFQQRVRLPVDEPSPTIISGGIRPQFQLGHPSQSRGLTVRERARLQSFSDDYSFSGGLTQGRVQTGMAVPPILASEIAECIKKMRS